MVFSISDNIYDKDNMNHQDTIKSNQCNDSKANRPCYLSLLLITEYSLSNTGQHFRHKVKIYLCALHVEILAENPAITYEDSKNCYFWVE